MSSEKNKNSDVVSVNIEPFIAPILIFMSVLVFSISFAFGLYSIGKGLENYGGGSGTRTVVTQPTAQPDGTGTEPTVTAGITKIGNSAKQGNEKAKVAIVEFSDFNCGFCQRHHTDGTAKSVMDNFVATGDVLHVYRNFPGVGGASTEAAANAALCVRSQTNDDTFYDLVDRIYRYESTTAKDEKTVVAVAKEMAGINISNLEKCIADGTFANDVQTDLSDGQSAGVSGTPSFIIGTLDSNGNVNGELVVGAQPYAEFERIIQSYM